MNTSRVVRLQIVLLAGASSAGLPSLSAQTEYLADGAPTALEEEIRWHTNRARFDTARENAARGTAFTDVPASSGPLAPNECLSRAARRAAGSLVQVRLENRTATSVSLTIPKSYAASAQLTLAPAESRVAGTFVLQSNTANKGFRDLQAPLPEIVRPALSLTRTGNNSLLSWPSQTGLQFLLQWSPDLTSWADLGGYQDGSGGVMTRSETTPGGTARRFYRLVVRRP